jgi:hypothetical protein
LVLNSVTSTPQWEHIRRRGVGTQFSSPYTAVDTAGRAARYMPSIENTLVRGGVGTQFSNPYTARYMPSIM